MNAVSAAYVFQYRARMHAVAALHRPRPGRPLTAAPRRVLLVCSGLLGDSVMSTPLITECRRLWPEARITLLGRRANCDLLWACPLLDELHETPALPFSLSGRSALDGLKRWLREQAFDAAFIALGDEFASLLAEVKIPVRVGVAGHPLSPCLTHTYKIGGPRTWGPRERLNALRCLGLDVRDAPPRLWVSPEARERARRKLAERGLADGPYVALHPFGSTPYQWWPAERVPALAQTLRAETGAAVLVIGGPETRGRLPETDSVVDATGILDIPELLAALEGARLVISTDSGPFHMAGALGRPLVGLFRSRRPEHAARYSEAEVIFGRDATCERECRWDRCVRCPCREMHAITAEDVSRAVRSAFPMPVAVPPRQETSLG